jgi:tetratricopeptide (TPR) repeat protein
MSGSGWVGPGVILDKGKMFMKKKLLVCLLAGALLLTGCGRGDAAASYQKGCQALEEGDFKTAQTHFQAVTKTDYYQAEAYRGLGLAQMSQTDYADACVSFEMSLLHIDRQDERFYRDVSLYLAYCRSYNGQEDRMAEIYDQLLKKDPDDAEVRFLRGKLKLNTGDRKGAKADFDAAVAVDQSYDLSINIYQCYDKLDQSADGASYLEHALDLANQNGGDDYSKGLVNYYLQNFEDAKECLIRAINKDESDSKAVFLLGEVYLKMDDVADARAVYTKALNSKKNAAGAYNGLALCDLRDGSYESARQNVEAGIALKDQSAEQGLLYNEIVICEKLRDWQTAKAKAAAYVAKYPTDELGVRENQFLKSR